jgi:hypothetical protein
MIIEVIQLCNGKRCICKCDICGKIIKQKGSHGLKNRNHFCSRICQFEFQKTLRGDKTSNWKGGRLTSHQSKYIRIYKPDHPYCDSLGYVYEHRLVMEQFLGRYLEPAEVIHHIDGDTTNNNIENLMLFSGTGSHLKYHALLRLNNSLGS